MDNLNQVPTPTPTPTPTPKTNLGIIGTVLALIGLIAFALPLGAAAIILGSIETPKNTWSYVAIVVGIIDVASVLYLLGTL